MTHARSGRFEGDSWDPASSVGATATMVAASRAIASQGPDPLLDDPLADPLVRAVGLPPFIRLLDGEVSFDDGDDPSHARRTRVEQMAVRTRFFDDFFIAATEAGVRQAVILASGLDTRAYRLLWPAGTVVYEIDQPQVIDFKTSTLADLGANPTAERRTVSIDLRDDWPTALRQQGFDVSQPAAWSAEGLLPYLPPEAQDRLFDNGRSVLSRRAQHRDRLPHRSRLAGNRPSCPRAVPAQWIYLPGRRGDGYVPEDELRQRDAEEIEQEWHAPMTTVGTWPLAWALPRPWSRRVALWRPRIPRG